MNSVDHMSRLHDKMFSSMTFKLFYQFLFLNSNTSKLKDCVPSANQQCKAQLFKKLEKSRRIVTEKSRVTVI